ncbi:MAG: hypothetical protein NTV31_10865, partial [Bacteroidia bacterium]|nr:hypothetical protein [Bacteroidia bacterium]
LARLDALEKRLAAATAAERPALEAELAGLAREALLANPLVTGAPIVFASDDHLSPDTVKTESIDEYMKIE